jgi:hypothetical protein
MGPVSRSVPKLSRPSRRFAIVVFQNPSEPFCAFDGVVQTRCVAWFLDELVVESLVITLRVIMFRLFADRVPKMTLPQWDHLSETFGFN